MQSLSRTLKEVGSLLVGVYPCHYDLLMPLVSDCSIGDNWTADGDWYAPDPQHGFFFYKSVGTGTVTSIRARGLCPSPPENATVIMQILNSTKLYEGGIKPAYMAYLT